jgi:hypothetical protein
MCSKNSNPKEQKKRKDGKGGKEKGKKKKPKKENRVNGDATSERTLKFMAGDIACFTSAMRNAIDADHGVSRVSQLIKASSPTPK